MTRRNGFTLVEVMIALMIFGMIAAAGVALLSFSVKAQGASGAALDEIGALNRLGSIMTADLAQAQDRPTREVNGVRVPAFTGDAAAVPILRLVRAGWSNPDAAPRATLQKVEYRLNEGALERVAYPALDGAPPLPPAVLLERVQAVRLRFRFAGAWSDRWSGQPRSALPQAVELVATREGGTSYRLLFLVGTGAVRPRATPTAAPTAGPTDAPA